MGLGVDGDVPAVVSPDGTHGLFPLAAGRATTRPSSFHPRTMGGVGVWWKCGTGTTMEQRDHRGREAERQRLVPWCRTRAHMQEGETP